MQRQIDRRRSEEDWLDATLADSFPASDPLPPHLPTIELPNPDAKAESKSDTDFASDPDARPAPPHR